MRGAVQFKILFIAISCKQREQNMKQENQTKVHDDQAKHKKQQEIIISYYSLNI